MKGFANGPGLGFNMLMCFQYHFALYKPALFPPHAEGFWFFSDLGIINANSDGLFTVVQNHRKCFSGQSSGFKKYEIKKTHKVAEHKILFSYMWNVLSQCVLSFVCVLFYFSFI